MITNETHCGNCSNWKQVDVYHGQCRLSPPQVAYTTTEQIETYWPEPDAYEQGCSAYIHDNDEQAAGTQGWIDKFTEGV